MKKARQIACFILMLFSFYGCSIDSADSNFQFVTLQVLSADFPESFELNQTHNIDVVYRRPDDCTFFEGFEANSTEKTTRIISAVGTMLTNQSCAALNEEVVATFNFRVDFAETYTFRFYSGTDASGEPIFIEYRVPVN